MCPPCLTLFHVHLMLPRKACLSGLAGLCLAVVLSVLCPNDVPLLLFKVEVHQLIALWHWSCLQFDFPDLQEWYGNLWGLPEGREGQRQEHLQPDRCRYVFFTSGKLREIRMLLVLQHEEMWASIALTAAHLSPRISSCVEWALQGYW